MGEMFCSHKLFISNELQKFCQCVFSALLFLWHFFFFMNGNELEWLLVGIKVLILFSVYFFLPNLLFTWHVFGLKGTLLIPPLLNAAL